MSEIRHIGSTTRAVNLEEVLDTNGFTGSARGASGMAVDLLALDEGVQAPPGLTIEQVGDAETLKQWYDVAFNGALGWPDCAVDAVLDYYMSVGLGAQSPRRY